jgi:branched-chain amino acid transport system substrate-binding protein
MAQRWVRTLLAGLAIALIPFAGNTPAARAAGEPFEIYALLSLTGPAAFAGKEEQSSLQLIEKMVNAAGGIRKRPIHFVISDTQTSPQIAVQLANEILAKKAPIFIGPDIVALCMAIFPLVQKAGPVEYCLSPGINPPSGGFLFSATAATRDDAVAIVRYFRERGWKRIALITSTDATGQSIEASVDRALAFPENRSVTLVAREHFNIQDLSVNAQIVSIRTQNPQAVIAWTTGTPFATLLRGLHDAGVDVPVAGSNGNMVFAQLAQYHDFIPREMYFPGRLGTAVGTRPGPILEAQKKYFGAFKAAGLRAAFVNANAWDPAMIVLSAFERLGFDATPEQIHAYMQQLHSFYGINGVYDFRDGEQRGIGLNAIVIDRYDKGKDEFIAVSRPGGLLR